MNVSVYRPDGLEGWNDSRDILNAKDLRQLHLSVGDVFRPVLDPSLVAFSEREREYQIQYHLPAEKNVDRDSGIFERAKRRRMLMHLIQLFLLLMPTAEVSVYMCPQE